MRTLDEIEAAVDKLPEPQQQELLSSLTVRLKSGVTGRSNDTRQGHSVRDIPSMSVGEVLHPISPADDLLGEMLDRQA